MTANLRYFFIYMILVFLATSCSSGTRPSRVVIDFSSLNLDSSNATPTKEKADAHSSDGPDWGQVDPVVTADIDCFGIFVYADEEGLKESSCTTAAGNTFQFGPRAGLFPITGNGEIFVPPGNNRRIILFGMRSGDKSCQSGFNENPDLDASNYSNPFLIGTAKVDITQGDNEVRIPILNQFTDNQKIKDCNFFKDDETDTTDKTISFNFPSSERKVWVDDNIGMRTVTVNHQGVSMECSKNNGQTYESCPSSTTITWEPSDLKVPHKVRVTYQDGSKVESANFIPDSNYPQQIFFVNCTLELTGNKSFDDHNTGSALSSALATNNSVICFSNNARATGTGSSNMTNIEITGNGVTLIARQGDSAEIQTGGFQDSVIIDAAQDAQIVGLRISNDTAIGLTRTLEIKNSSTRTFLEDVHIISRNSGGGEAIKIDNSGTNLAEGTVIHRALVEVINDPQGKGIVADTSCVTIKNSKIDGSQRAISTTGDADLIIEDSELLTKNNDPGPADIVLFIADESKVTASRTTFIDNRGYGIRLDASAEDVIFNSSNNTFIRSALATSGHDSPYFTVLGSDSGFINSVLPSLMCHEDSSVAAISMMLDGNEDPSSNFDPTQQVLGGIQDCP